jgi:hypothetical protein
MLRDSYSTLLATLGAVTAGLAVSVSVSLAGFVVFLTLAGLVKRVCR